MAVPAKGGRVGTNLTSGPILSTLLIFAIPIVLTNVVQQLYSMVDLAVIGQFVGNVGTVGVNTGGELADMVTPVAMGFATAGQILIAQLSGAGDDEKVKRTVGTLLTLMIVFSVALGALSLVFHEAVLRFLQCPQEAWGQAKAYMIITILGFPFIYGYNAVCGILRGMGESKRPLYFILVAATVNIFADILLVAVFKLEAAGTAIATVLSQAGSFFAAFWFMWKKRDQFDFELKLSYFKVDPELLKVLTRLAIPQIARSMMVRFGMIWVNRTANGFGMVVAGTNGVGNKIQKFLEVFVMGIDTAAASMIGQNLGARQIDRAGKTTICTWLAATACAVVSTILCLLFPHQIFRLFTNDETVIALGATFLRIFIIHFFSSALTGSFQAMVTGCGFVELGFVLGFLDGLACKIGFSLLFMNVFHMGYVGLWLGVACSRIIPGMVCVGYFLSGKWKTHKLLAGSKD